MAKRKLTDTSKPASRLDRLSRDLNRTFLHGARAKTNDGFIRPAAVVTGQQIAVEVPASGPMNFKFQIGSAERTVSVPRADAVSSETTMRAALGKPDKYLKLEIDHKIPTWVFHHREFTLPDPPVPEEVVTIADLKKTVLRLPATVLQEVQLVGRACDVSLWQKDTETQQGTVLPPTWQPAILLRFPLQTLKTQTLDRARRRVGSANEITFELRGTPQGDRYYLDLLGLLPGDSIPNAPGIDGVALFLEEPGSPLEPVKKWTMVRTNLTEEARHGQIRELSTEPTLPFVATEGQPEDTLRLLQMASITNSGGYYIRTSASKIPKTLITCVFLKPGKTEHDLSVSIPQAANAVVYENSTFKPNVARFEGNDSVQITPFVPPGFVAFGWTRTEPDEKQGDEEKFGYGTISLVDYQGIDAAGNVWEDANSGVAISPLRELPGEHVPKATAANIQDEHDGSRSSAAMRVLAPHHSEALIALAKKVRKDDISGLRYYRASMCCYAEKSESPYAPLGDAARRAITIAPGFRDVFGNRFKTAAEIKQRLFYTDALVAPAEWPGFRFSVFPGLDAGKPILTLEAAYTPLKDGTTSRYVRLTEILNQLKGAKSDVQMSLRAMPLLQSVPVLTKDLIKWLAETVIPSEHPSLVSLVDQWQPNTSYAVGALVIYDGVEYQCIQAHTSQLGSEPPTAPALWHSVTLFLRLPPYRCDGAAFTEPRLFQPQLEIARMDRSLLPQATDRPDDPVLSKLICDQIEKATSPVNLASKASGSLFLEDENRKDEFSLVAKAFQDNVSSAYDVQAAFLRDQLNQHELWLIPNILFPTVPAETEQAKWSYATARPLSNKLGTDEFLVPDFTERTTAKPNWKGYALKMEHFVEQDFDELARSAFTLVEREAFKPEVVTDPNNADSTRSALQAKDRISRRLAYFDGMGDPTYLLPVFTGSLSALDAKAISRLGRDAFLKNLNAFYTVDTLIQLPLDRLGDDKHISMFEGKVENPFPLDSKAGPEDPAKRLPAFAGILLKGGEKRVTVLYNVPPGTRDPNNDKGDEPEVPAIPNQPAALKVQITHVQRKLNVSAREGTPSFNRGSWLQLAVPVQLAWHGTGKCIPVVVRRFPAKPTIDGNPKVILPTLPDVPNVKASDVPLLIKWGWNATFVAEGLKSDTVHVAIRYNDPDTERSSQKAALDAEWEPTSVLHCLVVLKQLADNWITIPLTERIPLVSPLLASLSKFLSTRPLRLESMGTDQPKDLLDITFPRSPKEPPKPVSYQIMHQIDADTSDVRTGSGVGKRVALTALANASDNNAYLISSQDQGSPVAVVNFRPSLRLVRNEKIDNEPLDPRLIYECAVVEAPRECWARNSWTPPLLPLKYQPEKGQSLLDALQAFFKALFNGAPLPSFFVEVGAALQCQREKLSVHTAYSTVPIDMMPASVDEIANRVFRKCRDLLGGLGGDNVIPPAEMDESALRLHIKISQKGEAETVKRTLLEIAAIDFPLVAPKMEVRKTSWHSTENVRSAEVRRKASKSKKRV